MSTLRSHVTHTKQVRFHLDGDENGDAWVDVRIVNGQLEVKGADALAIFPQVSNVVLVESVNR